MSTMNTTTNPAAEVLTDEDVARIAWDSYGTLRTRQEYQFARAIEAEVTRRLEGQAIDPDWLMLKAGQEALFDYLPDCTIEEREELSRDVFLAMCATLSPALEAASPAAEPEAIAQLRHLVDDLVVAHEDAHGLVFYSVHPRKCLLFSNMVEACKRLLAAPSPEAAPVDPVQPEPVDVHVDSAVPLKAFPGAADVSQKP